MLRITIFLVILSAISFNGLAQQNVRIIQTSGNGSTRQINNTTVPVIEKKDVNKNSSSVNPSQNDSRKNIKPANNRSRPISRNQSQKLK